MTFTYAGMHRLLSYISVAMPVASAQTTVRFDVQSSNGFFFTKERGAFIFNICEKSPRGLVPPTPQHRRSNTNPRSLIDSRANAVIIYEIFQFP
ncbi:hypothetical protein BDP81DRAFT_426167 [Colletotrichum phormii]|uniref:Secreted protein n=1 Tax=Colletotrichum phormii TaxID=359342 RepID=A0AAI9ZTK6_9PEZI|nr:uncharacterized protein BDP81DRAFT_426167 [Colletotrichum phormii]KAK1637921.1 hypothetical protein BDP81DRAFT_426167 [Colletotrichum phormii]